jgi:soluble lytic murein transglycosylase-like protein
MKSKIRKSIRKRRLHYKIALVIFVISPLLIYGSINCVDRACGLKYPALPTQEIRTSSPEESYTTIQTPIYDIPLSAELQEFTYQKCIQYDVDYIMVLAIMQTESRFKPDVIKDGNYGLMQINESNFQYLKESMGITDFLDPQQNIEAGIFFLSGIYENNTEPEKILMVYNMGGRIAQELWDMGRESTGYSRAIMKNMDEIRERQVKT